MKNKNFTKLRILVVMLVVSSAMILGSCGKDDKIAVGDKTALNTLIAKADSIDDAATTADYSQTDIDAYKATLQTIKTVAATELTQEQIDSLVEQLTVAIIDLLVSPWTPWVESLDLNLIAGWHFDEGTDTIVTAFSTVKHVGTFTKGNVAILGNAAEMPTWVNGVKGGKAIHLNNGAHIEVPYTSAFLPASITISAWIKPDMLYENNIIVSQNYWWGYKFQTQNEGKPFFTARINFTTCIDADADVVAVGVGVWSHVVVTLNSSTKIMNFYVNGVPAKTWTAANKVVGPLTQTLNFSGVLDGKDFTIDPQPFIIGAWATDAEMARNMPWASANYGFFNGAIDELKIYNIALRDDQVTRLYNIEKP